MAVDKSRVTPDVLDVDAAAAREPGALTAMPNWYRAAIRHGATVAHGGRVEVPVLTVRDQEDRAPGPETPDGVDRSVRDVTIRRLPACPTGCSRRRRRR